MLDLEALENRVLVHWADSFVVVAIGNAVEDFADSVVEEHFVDMMVVAWHQGY